MRDPDDAIDPLVGPTQAQKEAHPGEFFVPEVGGPGRWVTDQKLAVFVPMVI